MKANDFNLPDELTFQFDAGITTFRDSRLVIFDAEAIGLLRQNLIEMVGREKARAFFLRFGFQNGYSDFMQIKLNYEFDSEIELLASGPVIHTWEGVVKATPTEIRFDRDTGDFYFTGIWLNSYEAEQHLSYSTEMDEPVCWSLMGYASGWCTAFFQKPLLAIEPSCMGMGHEVCQWEIKPVSEWGEKGKPYWDALSDLYIKGNHHG